MFTAKKLQFRPPIEELRASYYREMKKFIAMPSVFQGFGGASSPPSVGSSSSSSAKAAAGQNSVYARMAEQNVASMVQVYTKAEDLFDRLAKLKESLVPWVVLGMVPDLDAYVEENVTEVVQVHIH